MTSLPALSEMLRADLTHLHERPVSREPVYKGNLLHVVRDQVALADGQNATREMILHPGAVMIVPVLSDGRVVVELQYRHPLGQVVIEFPAGKLDADESRLLGAQRELREETGFAAKRWAHMGEVAPAIAYSDERIDMWLATDLVAGHTERDEGELLEVCAAEVSELKALVHSGVICDSKTLAGLMWLCDWRAGEWSPQWR